MDAMIPASDSTSTDHSTDSDAGQELLVEEVSIDGMCGVY